MEKKNKGSIQAQAWQQQRSSTTILKTATVFVTTNTLRNSTS
jgi:hypothetical protein